MRQYKLQENIGGFRPPSGAGGGGKPPPYRGCGYDDAQGRAQKRRAAALPGMRYPVPRAMEGGPQFPANIFRRTEKPRRSSFLKMPGAFCNACS